MWREFMPNTNSYGGSFTIPKQLHVDELSFTADLLTIYASTTDLAAECPLCGQLSLRIHGCYMRTLADLPWCGTPVRLRVRVRKFFCDEPSCERKIFAERLAVGDAPLRPRHRPPEGRSGVDRFGSWRRGWSQVGPRVGI